MLGELFRKKAKKTLAAALAVMLFAAIITAYPNITSSAKKPVLNKKKIVLNVGNTYKIKVKNSVNSSKVLWKTENKKVASIIKKNTKGKNAYALIKGESAGISKITAIYKRGKKQTMLSCKVTVRDESAGQETQVNAENSGDKTKNAQTPQKPVVPVDTDKPAALTTTQPTPVKTPIAVHRAYQTPMPSKTPFVEPESDSFCYLDLSNDSNIYNVYNGSNITHNDDGTITIVFDRQFASVGFYLSERVKSKYVTIDYVSEGGNLSDAHYDNLLRIPEDDETSRHVDWSQRIVASPNGNRVTIKLAVSYDEAYITGFELINPQKDGFVTTIRIRDIIFSTTLEDIPEQRPMGPLPTRDPAAPTPTPTPLPTMAPTASPTTTPVPTMAPVRTAKPA